MGELEADLPSLERFAGSSLGRRDEFEHLRARMDGLHLPRVSFGYIPGIGNRVYGVYDEFVHSCAVAVGSAAESMEAVAEAVRDTATAYAGSDGSSKAALGAIEFGMAGTDLREVK
jgi:hypothetical protein